MLKVFLVQVVHHSGDMVNKGTLLFNTFQTPILNLELGYRAYGEE